MSLPMTVPMVETGFSDGVTTKPTILSVLFNGDEITSASANGIIISRLTMSLPMIVPMVETGFSDGVTTKPTILSVFLSGGSTMSTPAVGIGAMPLCGTTAAAVGDYLTMQPESHSGQTITSIGSAGGFRPARGRKVHESDHNGKFVCMSRITSTCSSPYLFHMVEALVTALSADDRILIPEIVTITVEAEPPLTVDSDFTAIAQPIVQSEPMVELAFYLSEMRSAGGHKENESDYINFFKFLPHDHFLPHGRRITVPVEAGSADGLRFRSCFFRRQLCSPSSRGFSLHGEATTSVLAFLQSAIQLEEKKDVSLITAANSLA
jgi:hypothetical protein